MRNKFGAACMILGAALVLAALSLFIWNQMEDQRAGAAVEEILPQLLEQVQQMQAKDSAGATAGTTDAALPIAEGTSMETVDASMTEVEIDGYYYIGYLSIPALDLELPVMSSWSYEQLKIAPCRYAGSTKTDDLVIAAHNYVRHFAYLKKLSIGDEVYFTDMDGVVSAYAVAEVDMLASTDVEKMTAGDYPLTLFTCTYGNQSRVTVRCSKISE